MLPDVINGLLSSQALQLTDRFEINPAQTELFSSRVRFAEVEIK